MRRRLLLLILLVTAISLSIVTVLKIRPEVTRKGDMFILSETSGILLYDIVTDNTMNCDLATFSSIVNNMKEDGFVIESKETSKDEIDVVLSKDNQKFRIQYKRDGSFVSLGIPYEKSFIPLTYISKEVLSNLTE